MLLQIVRPNISNEANTIFHQHAILALHRHQFEASKSSLSTHIVPQYDPTIPNLHPHQLEVAEPTLCVVPQCDHTILNSHPGSSVLSHKVSDPSLFSRMVRYDHLIFLLFKHILYNKCNSIVADMDQELFI